MVSLDVKNSFDMYGKAIYFDVTKSRDDIFDRNRYN